MLHSPSTRLCLHHDSSLGTAEKGWGWLQGQQRALLDSIRLHYGSALCVRGGAQSCRRLVPTLQQQPGGG